MVRVRHFLLQKCYTLDQVWVSTSLSYITERRERDGKMRGEPRNRINFKAAMLNWQAQMLIERRAEV